MPTRKRNVEIEVKVDDAHARSQLKGLGDTASTTGKGFSTMAGLAKIGIAGIVSSGLVSFLGDATKAAMDDQRAQEDLKVALQNTTGATDDEVEATENFIDKTQMATGIADDELRPALAELTRATGDLDTAQDLLGDAMDIATAKGMPLESVTRALGKAAQGNLGPLGRLGLALKDTEGNAFTFEEILANAASTMGGATAAAADTAEGKMRIFRISVEEAKEALGNALLPVLADTTGVLSDTLGVATLLGEKFEDIGGTGAGEGAPGATDAFLAMIPIVGQIWTGFQNFGTAISGTYDWMVKNKEAAEELEGPLATAADRYDDMNEATDGATEALEDFEDEVRSQMDPVFNLADKINDLAEAQANTGKVRDEYGEGSPEHLEALRKEAEKWLEVKDAQLRMAQESGITRDTYRTNLEAMGIFTKEEVDVMIAEFDRLDGRVIDTTINVNLRGGGAGSFSDVVKGVTARQHGGPVKAGGTYLVGESGPELLTMGSNGHVTPNGMGGTQIIQLVVDRKVLAEVVREQFVRDNRGGRSWT